MERASKLPNRLASRRSFLRAGLVLPIDGGNPSLSAIGNTPTARSATFAPAVS